MDLECPNMDPKIVEVKPERKLTIRTYMHFQNALNIHYTKHSFEKPYVTHDLFT